MRALLNDDKKLKKDDKKLKKTAKAMREKFVFLNVYCRSVEDERDPRGPEGPYRFKDRSVPVIVIKKWDGTTLKQQLGWGDGGAKGLGRMIDKAVKDNGPVAPPKALRPLLKSYAKAKQALEKKQTRNAIRELQKVVKAAQNKKKFKDGMPDIAIKAEADLEELKRKALDELQQIESKLEEQDQDAKHGKRALNRLMSRYGGILAVKTRIRAVQKKLDG